jgi:hypothetical protein
MHRIGDDLLPALIEREDTDHQGHDGRDVLSLRFVGSEAMLVDLERTDLRFERRSRDAEPRRRPGRAGYAALARGERRLDSTPRCILSERSLRSVCRSSG